jgi:4-carboxymuconolactone decarboxylase
MTDESRERGHRMMSEVYGWDVDEPSDDFMKVTLDHLFGDIWSREILSVRERRLLMIGLLVGQDLYDVAELQLQSALRVGEMSIEEMREIVLFLTHYAGWPRGAKLHTIVEKLAGGQE